MESIEPPAEYPYSRVLDEIQQAGYKGTELGPYGFLPTDPIVLRGELERRALTLCSAFVAMPLGEAASREEGLAHVTRTASLIREVGCQLLILADEISPSRCGTAGRLKESNQLSWTELEWQNAERAIRDVLSCTRRLGLRVAFHNHVGTHIETPQEVERLVAIFQPPELGLCLDTGHYVFGGGDPTELLERHAHRILCVHFKDVNTARLEEARRQRLDFYAAIRYGVFAPLGRGGIDFAAVLELLAQNKFDGWIVVEQDVLARGSDADSPLANARVGREFLRAHGL